MDMEKLGFKKAELSEKQSILIEKLREFEKHPLVKKIIEGVEYGFVKDAKLLCFTESDKFRSMPEVIEILKTYLFDEGEDRPWDRFKRK
ncbi:MAG: hypothetical protein A2469_02480 [Candidatus Magasanikbacteria bacterium RIFOXYC2_FULL_40_16]|uniref:Uncharacterized protein n=3 Tax=Candidatus Magasanikiibacteriota TaxID=1752731 RepID=A0A1F6NFM7_9BACT|nr:MAG: hypothetical protein A2224_00880 [Candidatus Magasanikbacteria bacterium RIFOXYA2_FULL_40_20]OGH82806.1 MAG: hypothetical protein A2373_01045 [Candidatus Magasanikbacteria bacterium RIFOXYB1_FULL_40_15]OGH86991.1 MAG: hypothetical protein A2301_01650 [Candidatus Magasanikbacteria bacterium RIFOXYB2_FULL_40_13]OGH87915.1 MAG: hypothetical protein A2206_03640 [Candidatus Magasanikbacteria bacterium RIFOXYA1_FULL_40_8]OGH89407.1 MAG: hypothetical protein A2469_02480 [Candidatus Magasanikba